MSGTIQTGNYTIFSRFRGGFFGSPSANIFNATDTLLHPVQLLAPGASGPRWSFNLIGDGKCILRLGTTHHAVAKDGLVWVTQDTNVPPTEWHAMYTPQHGINTYLIVATPVVGVWTVPKSSEPGGQLWMEKYLVATPSIPPNFPTTAQFDLDRLD